MIKVILMCGRICSGKSTYADRIRREKRAVLLSADEIMLAMFGQYVGEKHDNYVASIQKYLFEKSTELVEVGINVIMDLGLWTKSERQEARDFYNSRKIANEIHYMDISDEEWKKRIEKRNRDIAENKVSAYYVDEGLAEKVSEIFEKPGKSEVDVWVKY